MPNLSSTTQTIHVHWMRDSLQGGFAYPFTSTLTTGQTLTAVVEKLLGRKLHLETDQFLQNLTAKFPAGKCEFHLPFVGRKELECLDRILQEAILVEDTKNVFRLSRTGEDFEDEFFRQCLTLMAPAFFPVDADVPFSVVFNYYSEAAAGAYLPWFPQASAGMDGRVCTPLKVTLALTQHSEGGWNNTTPERNRQFLPVYSKVSVSLRKALRFWAPFQYFTERNSYADSALVWPMMAWAATSSPQAKNIRDFSSDILDVDSMERACRSLRRNLRGYLEKIAPALRAMQLSDAIRRYSPCRATEGADLAVYNHKNLFSLFAGETDLFDLAQRIGLDLAELRLDNKVPEGQRLRKFHKVVRAFSHDFVVRLRHFYASKNWESTATILLLAMTSSLNKQPTPLNTFVNEAAISVATDEIEVGHQLRAA